MLKGPPPEIREKMQKLLEKYSPPISGRNCAVTEDVLESERKLGGAVWLKVAAARWKERKECQSKLQSSTEKTNVSSLTSMESCRESIKAKKQLEQQPHFQDKS